LASTTSMRSMRRKISVTATPDCGWRPTSQVNTTSSVDTGVPSLQRALGWMVKRTVMPRVPSGRSTMAARPFSIVGSSVHRKQLTFHSRSGPLIGRVAM